MNPFSEAREAVSAVLGALPGVTVYGQMPSTVSPPAVVIAPGSPWIDARGHVTLELTCYVTSSSGTGESLTALEELVSATRDALRNGGIPTGNVDAPNTDSTSGTVSAGMPITLRIC